MTRLGSEIKSMRRTNGDAMVSNPEHNSSGDLSGTMYHDASFSFGKRQREAKD